MTANRGRNTFHCPLGQEAEGWTAETVLKITGKHTAGLQDGTKRNPNLTLPLSSRDLWEPPPACLPTLPASGMGTNTTKPFSQPKPLSREQEQREGQTEATCIVAKT